jgi:hypothetical protein
MEGIREALTVGELQEKIVESLGRLSALDAVSGCDVNVLPGKVPDSAVVHFTIADHDWYRFKPALVPNREGGAT